MSTLMLAEPISATTDVVGDDELYEIIDGQRVRIPPMGVFAVWIASELHFHLSYFARTHGTGRAIIEALFHLPAPINRDRRPDIAYVSYERWARNRPIPPTDNAWDVIPNLVTEVVSPTDTAEELEQKVAEYFQSGVQLVWVVYPMQAKVHVYQAPADITAIPRTGVLDGGVVVPGFQLALADLFMDPAETATATNGPLEKV